MSAEPSTSTDPAAEATTSGNITWDPATEILLYQAMKDQRPVGPNKHFRMISIRDHFNANSEQQASFEDLWDKLKTLYDLERLERMEFKKVTSQRPKTEFTLVGHPDFRDLLKGKSGSGGVSDSSEALQLDSKSEGSSGEEGKEEEPNSKSAPESENESQPSGASTPVHTTPAVTVVGRAPPKTTSKSRRQSTASDTVAKSIDSTPTTTPTTTNTRKRDRSHETHTPARTLRGIGSASVHVSMNPAAAAAESAKNSDDDTAKEVNGDAGLTLITTSTSTPKGLQSSSKSRDHSTDSAKESTTTTTPAVSKSKSASSAKSRANSATPVTPGSELIKKKLRERLTPNIFGYITPKTSKGPSRASVTAAAAAVVADQDSTPAVPATTPNSRDSSNKKRKVSSKMN